MTLLVDTSVWSLALRRDTPDEGPEVTHLRSALAGRELVVITGVVVLELLRGSLPDRVRAAVQIAAAASTWVEPTREDYAAAAELSNTCRRAGIRLDTVDALIAQLCVANDLTLLTADQDFRHAARHIGLDVWMPR